MRNTPMRDTPIYIGWRKGVAFVAGGGVEYGSARLSRSTAAVPMLGRDVASGITGGLAGRQPPGQVRRLRTDGHLWTPWPSSRFQTIRRLQTVYELFAYDAHLVFGRTRQASSEHSKDLLGIPNTTARAVACTYLMPT